MPELDASRTAQEQLKLLLDLTNSVVSTLDLRELLRNISGNLRRLCAADLVGVGLPDAESSRHLRLYALDFPKGRGFVKGKKALSPSRNCPAGFQDWRSLRGNDPRRRLHEPGLSPVAEGLTTGCVLPLASRGGARSSDARCGAMKTRLAGTTSSF